MQEGIENVNNQLPEQNFEEAVEIVPAIKRGWLRALLFLVVSFLNLVFMSFVGVIVVAMIADINLVEMIENKDMIIENVGIFPFIVINLIPFITLLIIIWVFRKFIDKKSIVSLGFALRNYKNDLLQGSLWGVGLILFGFVVLYLSGIISVTDSNIDFISLTGYFLLFVITSLNEEILVRGYLLNNLCTSMNKYIALLISSILFAMLHLGNENMSLLPFINLFLAGILLGIYYIHKQNLWFSIGMHLTWNFFQGPIFGFEVSGNKTASVVVQEISGNELITGGEFGFEGSLVATVLMMILIILIDRKYKII